MPPPRVFLLAVTLVACLSSVAAGGRIEAVPRALSSHDSGHSRFGECEVLGILQLHWSGERWFGGFSGLAMDGDRVTAINDSGHWVGFRLAVDADGRPLGVTDGWLASLGGLDGTRDDGDAEEVVATPEGFVVSFERRHRLLLYPNGLSGKPHSLAAPQGFTRMPFNGGAEAVARLLDGRLLIIAEESDDDTSPAWVGRAGAWERLSYRRHGLFHPSGATTLPNGDVLVLERRFTVWGWLAVRLVRLAADGIQAGTILDGHELAVLEPPLLVDNFEGVAVRRRSSDGRLVAYLLSDDNFLPFQATLLMAVLLPP